MALAILSTSLLMLLCTAVHGANQLTLELLPKDMKEGGKCMDGSPAGFYYEAPINLLGEDLFVIFMQGGGHCITESDCIARSKTDLGSSNNWPTTMMGNGSFSSSESVNPDF